MIKQHGFKFLPESRIFEKIPDRKKKPDFFVLPKDHLPFLVEVESFEKPTVLRTRKFRIISLGHMHLQKRINRAVRKAADQLEPYSDLGFPLVVVLDNHRRVGLSLGEHGLKSLFGEQHIAFNIDIESRSMIDRPRIEHQDDGSPFAGGKRSFISAVLVNEPEYQDDDYTIERSMRARVIHHPYRLNPLPFSLFQDAGDEHIFYRNGTWQKFKDPGKM